MENGYHFPVILNELSELDYWIEWRIINPITFGIHQNRHIIFFICGTKLNSTNINYHLLENRSVSLGKEDWTDLYDIEAFIRYMLPISASKGKNCNWGITYKNKMLTRNLSFLPDIKPRKLLKDILED
jgi:DNA (cytosine-5)-methyltransferase 1